YALVLVLGYKPPWTRTLEVTSVAQELAEQLRLVRSEAIARNRELTLRLDLSGHSYRAAANPPRTLPLSLSLELVTVAGERASAEIGDIRFNPDGSSTGGRIVLADGYRKIVVGVDWLTGRVSVADVR